MSIQSWAEHRHEAILLAAEQQQFLSDTKHAFYNGDAATIKELKEKRIAYQNLIVAANKKAADAIFDQNNRRYPTLKIDLHGLYVREAIQKLSQRIDKAVSENVHELIVVVGRGLNSVAGPKIQPAVEKYAKERHIPCQNILAAGCLVLDLGKRCSEYSNNRNCGSSDDGDDVQRKHSPPTEYGKFVYQESVSISTTPVTNDDSDVLLSFLRRAKSCKIRCGRT